MSELRYTTLLDPFVERTTGSTRANTYLKFKRAHGEPYSSITYEEFGHMVREAAAGLHALGLRRGDRIALVSESRPEWLVTDFAALSLGLIIVPMFPTLTPKQIEFIVQDSGAKLLLVSNDLQLGKAQKIASECPELLTIVLFNDATKLAQPGQAPPLIHFRELRSRASEALDLDAEIHRATPEDIAAIIYTSGTTGNPKGVILTHDNIVSNLTGALATLPELSERDVALSFLPLCHTFEHAAMHLFMLKGFTVAFAESVDTVAENLIEIRPTIMTGVPRFYERIHLRIMRMRDKLPPLRKKVFDLSLRVGEMNGVAFEGKRVPLMGRLLRPIADALVLKKVRERTGGRIRFFVSGAAPLPAEVGCAFASFGLPIVEGYGMTESSPIITVSPYQRLKWGTVGFAIPNIELQIASDGEILTRGPHVMKGYYNQPEATREAIDADGWLHTGDIGEFDQEGYLRITDRKKHLFVSTGGKNIAPAPIEALLSQSLFVDQIMLIGDKRQYLSALIVPDREAIRTLGSDAEKLLRHSASLLAAVQSDIDHLQREHASYERVRRIAILEEPFTVENGMMTPTLKVKRKVVEERYRELIDSLYQVRQSS